MDQTKASFFTSERKKGFILALAVFASTFLFRYLFLFVFNSINNWIVDFTVWGINMTLFVTVILGLSSQEYKQNAQGAFMAWLFVVIATMVSVYLSLIVNK